MKHWRFLLLPLLLAACTAEPAAYLISGGDVSITVERIKPYFWSKGWNLDMVVSRSPECQRRYQMNPAGETVQVDIYRPQAGVYILHQGQHWYVTELEHCGFQAYKTPPPVPGDLVGAFREKGGVFAFVEANAASRRAVPENR